MLFLIDFENVRNAGMRGCEFLQASDWVIVFYSKESPNMETRFLESIRDSGCRFEVCKLVQAKKISEMSKHRDLWKVLHDCGIYDKSESNWNQQVK